MTDQTSPSPAPTQRALEPGDRGAGVSEAGGRGPRGARLGVAALLVLAVFVAYLPALSGQFIYDDLKLVQSNPNSASLGAAARAFFEPLWAFASFQADFQNAFWRPLTVFALALGRTLSGGEPGGFHLLAVLLHAAATLAAWRLAARLLRSEVLGGAVGLFFALHPVHVESVAWISAVNDPLYGLFALLALNAHLAWRQRGSRGLPWASAVCTLLALLAKEQALAILPLLVLLDLCLGHLKGSADEDPFALLGRAFGLQVAMLGLYWVGRVVAYDGSLLAGFDQVGAGFGMTVAQALRFRLQMFGSFVALLFAPVDQAVFRMVRSPMPDPYPEWTRALAASGAWLAAVLWAAVARAPRALAMLLAIPVALALLLVRFTSAGGFPISDRYLYVPVVFAGVLLAWIASRRLSRENAATVVGLVALGFGLKTYRYARDFHDEERFFRTAVAASPELPYVRWGLGRVLLEKFRGLGQREDLDEATFHFYMSLKLGTDYGQYEQALADELAPDQSFLVRTQALEKLINGTPPEGRRPDPTVTWTLFDRLQANQGVAQCLLHLAPLLEEPDYDVPLTIFRATVQMAPDDPGPHLGLGTVLMAMGRLDEAERELSRAVELNRGYPEAWHNLALCFQRQERWDEARAAHSEALRMRPGDLDDLRGVVECAINAGRMDVAQRTLDEALARFPGVVDLAYLRGLLAAKRGDFTTALTVLDDVIARQPNHAQAYLTRGMVFTVQERVEQAADDLRHACELAPQNFQAHYNLAVLMLQLGQKDSAALYLERAYFLSPPDEQRQAIHDQLVVLSGKEAGKFFQLALADQRRGDYAHALDFADRSLVLLHDEFTPPERFAQVNYLRGTLLRAMQQPDEAIQAYQDCLLSSPNEFDALHDLAVVHAYMKRDVASARSYAERALAQLDQVADRPADQVAAMRRLLTALANAELPTGPLLELDPPGPDGADPGPENPGDRDGR